ncbi:hypothetical protein CMUS01_08319 [Colletotrichum musicola]|uniref:Uncharacterized protein n=1 Tax=Colletotrichum musicola TaxID=2175873 RepID=A0A8H6KDK8_9PEZI|nr:hypothetical protein CMUS01_08319 [Colletotrichum musicola]
MLFDPPVILPPSEWPDHLSPPPPPPSLAITRCQPAYAQRYSLLVFEVAAAEKEGASRNSLSDRATARNILATMLAKLPTGQTAFAFFMPCKIRHASPHSVRVFRGQSRFTAAPAPFGLFDQPNTGLDDELVLTCPVDPLPNDAMGHGSWDGTLPTLLESQGQTAPEGGYYVEAGEDPDLWVRNVQMNRRANVRLTDSLLCSWITTHDQAHALSSSLVLRRDTHYTIFWQCPAVPSLNQPVPYLTAPHRTAPEWESRISDTSEHTPRGRHQQDTRHGRTN